MLTTCGSPLSRTIDAVTSGYSSHEASMFSMFIAVFIGGGVGSVVRLALSTRFNSPIISVLPVGTLLANLVGAFIIGGALAYFSRHAQLDAQWRMLITTGFCGGLTTFSTFSAEVFTLLGQGQLGAAGIHTLLNLGGSFLMTALAFTLVNWLVS